MIRDNLKVPVKRNFERMTITAPSINFTWCIDLMVLTSKESDKIIYVMNCVDILSRYAGSVKLTNKNTAQIKHGLKEMFNFFEAKPKKIWTDKEGAIYSADIQQWIKSFGIETYVTQNSYKGDYSVPIVERFNRTFREAMDKYATTKPMNKDQLVNYTIEHFIPEYNQNVHSTLKATPDEVYHKDVDEKIILKEQYTRAEEPKQEPKKKLLLYEFVYLQKPKETIRNKNDSKYYNTAYQIVKVNNTNPTTYQLGGMGRTRYYQQQLLVVKDPRKRKGIYKNADETTDEDD